MTQNAVRITMRTPRIYLETTIFNFVFADDAPEKRDCTLTLFEEIKQGKYMPFTSAYALDEINNASEPKRTKLFKLLEKYNVIQIKINEKVEQLAEAYIKEGIIPVKYATDASHIAAASVADMDFIVSWNFKHIVKRKTILMTELINYKEGYKRVGIHSPLEVIEHD